MQQKQGPQQCKMLVLRSAATCYTVLSYVHAFLNGGYHSLQQGFAAQSTEGSACQINRSLHGGQCQSILTPWAPRQSTRLNWTINNGHERVERRRCIRVNPISTGGGMEFGNGPQQRSTYRVLIAWTLRQAAACVSAHPTRQVAELAWVYTNYRPESCDLTNHVSRRALQSLASQTDTICMVFHLVGLFVLIKMVKQLKRSHTAGRSCQIWPYAYRWALNDMQGEGEQMKYTGYNYLPLHFQSLISGKS